MHDDKESPQAESSVLQLGLRFATEFSQQAQQHPDGQQRDSGIREKTTLQGKKPKLQGETLRCLKALQPQACSEWRSGDEIRRTMHSALKLVRFSLLTSVGDGSEPLTGRLHVRRLRGLWSSGRWGRWKEHFWIKASLPCQHLNDSHLPPLLTFPRLWLDLTTEWEPQR